MTVYFSPGSNGGQPVKQSHPWRRGKEERRAINQRIRDLRAAHARVRKTKGDR